MPLLQNRNKAQALIRGGVTLFLLGFLLSGCAFKQAVFTLLSTQPVETPVPAATELISTPTVISSTPTPVCVETTGQVIRTSLESEALAGDLFVSVYLPACYDPTRQGGYPVLYLLHGQNQDDRFWNKLGFIDLVNQAIAAGHRPFIIIMPYEKENFEDVATSKFGLAVLDDLMPWVEQHYNVSPERQDHAIGGISRGAGWAIHLVLQKLDYFGTLGAHSPGVFGFDWTRVGRVRQTVAAEDFPRIYIDRGVDDFLAEHTDQFAKALEENGVDFEYEVQPGDHSEYYWRKHLQDYLQWYMQGWDEEP